MKKIIKQVFLVIAMAIAVSSTQPSVALAAPKKYVKSLSVSKKKVNINIGKSKSISYKVRVKGKVSKKITVKASNSKVKAVVKKGKIKITAKKTGSSKITIATKGKNKKGRKIKKTIVVKIVKKKASASAAPSVPAGPSLPVVLPNPSAEVTRAEWISSVMQATGYNIQKDIFKYDENENVLYSFTDISGNTKADIIETAARYGIIPESGGTFNPNSAADREFLAVTAVRAIGFAANEVEFSCSDKRDLKYATEDAVAIQLKLLALSGNRFLPAKSVTKSEKQNAEKILTDIIKEREIDEDHIDSIEYQPDVSHEENITDYTVSEQDGIYTVIVAGTKLKELEKGDKLVLPATDDYPEGIALIVSSNILSSDNKSRIITGTIPDEITEFIESVDIEGHANAKAGEITAVDGVATVNAVTVNKNSGNISTKAKTEGEIDLSDKIRVTYTVNEIKTTVSFYLSSLKYSVDFNKKGVKKLYIGLPSVLSLETDYKASKNFSKKIGDIPVELVAGFSANIEVYLEADISGQITLDFKLTNNIGMHYYNGNFYIEKSCNPDFEAIVDADIDAGAKLQLGLYWMKGIMEIFGKKDSRPVYNLYTKWGVHGDAALKIRNDKYTSNKRLVCVDLGYYLYGNVNAGNGSFLGDKFNLKYEWIIFDGKNSPLKGDLHMENGERVHACTYKVPVKVVLEDYAKQFTYLCNDTQIYEVYASYEEPDDTGYFKTTDNIPSRPLAYDIDDYDHDNIEELLVVNLKPYNITNANYQPESSKAVYFEMYEVEDGRVVKKAVSDYQFDEDYFTSIYNAAADNEMFVYKYQENNSLRIALEWHGLGVWSDGYMVGFKVIDYDGKKFRNIGANVYGGSDWDDDYLQRIERDYEGLGIRVNAEQLLSADVSVYEYVNNPYIMGKTKTVITGDIENLLMNPSSRYKIADVFLNCDSGTNSSVFESMPRGFDFSSGAGAWGTHIDIENDGSFVGQYHDTEMGDVGEDYPNGTVFICNFSGKFSNPKQIDKYTYSMKLDRLETDGNLGDSYIKDGTMYINSEPYGFDDADEFIIYAPGMKISELPEGFVFWLNGFMNVQTTKILPYYGIYNVSGEEGFVGYK